jgi:hypothetical protein
MEEYLIKKNKDQNGETDKDAVTLGDTYQVLRSKLLSKFKSSDNPEKEVNRITATAEKIYSNGIGLLKVKNSHHNLLLVGKVQSGKTSNLEVLTAMAFDSGFNSIILFGGYDSVLLGQANSRFKLDFNVNENDPENSDVQFFSTDKSEDIKAFDNDVLEAILDSGEKMIFTAMKKPGAISKLNDMLSRLDLSLLKPIIIDDEGDQASLNTEYRKQKVSRTYEEICRMKKTLNNPLYLSVTATPEALLFSPKMSELIPDKVNLIPPGTGYVGIDQYHGNDDHICYVPDDMLECLEKDRIPEMLKTALGHYFIASAIMRRRGILKSDMIIHSVGQIEPHKIIYSQIKDYYLESFRNAIARNEEGSLKRKLGELEKIYYDHRYFSPEISSATPFSDLIPQIEYVIQKVHVVLQNSVGKSTMAGLTYRSHTIRIGANLLQRGVSFDHLVTTYFTRWPTTKGNMDTSIQRARWLGYRTKFFDLCRLFCTSQIAYKFSKLAEIENDLWSQLESIESGSSSLNDILVEDKAQLALIPARKNVISIKEGVFGLKWLNQSFGLRNPDDLQKNAGVLQTLICKHSWLPTHEGRTKDENIVASYSEISYEEAQDLFTQTIGIFTSAPFGSPSSLLSAIGTRKIFLELFWDQGDRNGLEKGTRNRTFSDVENGWRVSALQQGADVSDEEKKKYLGDSHVIVDPDAAIIQVFSILPRNEAKEKLLKYKQFMYSLHVPQFYSVFMRDDK